MRQAINMQAMGAVLSAGPIFAPGTHRILSSYEWCGGGSLTTVSFIIMSGHYTARRFWRADTGTRGVEIYVRDADGTEWMTGYANPANPNDAKVIAEIERTILIDLARTDRTAVHTDDATRARYDAIEL